MTEHNINESMINENPEDKLASDEAAAEAHEPAEDVEVAPGEEKLTPEKLGEAAIKFATETAFAAAGFAGHVGEKAKAFFDEQKKQYAAAHPEDDEPKSNAFLDQLSEQLSRFADDMSRGYREMAEKGREVVSRNTPKNWTKDSEGAVNDGETPVDSEAPTFSSDLSGDVSEASSGDAAPHFKDAEASGFINDGDSPVADDATAFSSDLSEDVSEKAPESDDVLDRNEQDGIL
ncbi:MAG: hypothetical protein Q4P15_00115 [Propionibacteriaceae bacterium]|nr:hypothetical protein [Propionibacteriaceae bacterium]